ncbi:MAG: 2-amino-4-hydroxy-6-hydroxymethyldihydropteridine diphosphokinase [Syntrophales bacterium]
MQARLPDDFRGVIAFIGIGSNIGDPAARCTEALCRLSQASGTKVLRQSSLYRTEPVGFEKQDWFINAVAEIRTLLTPHELLRAAQAIEDEMGRVRGPRWGPRVIDLDILLYGQEVVKDDDLVIPHPELHKRRFMLEPLCEIASYAIHPVFGVSARGLMERLDDDSRVYLYSGRGEQCLA